MSARKAPKPVETKPDDRLTPATWCVALLCALALPTGATQLAPGIVSSPGSLNKDAATAMIQVFLLTGPLVLGAAFLTLTALRGWFGNDGIAIVIAVCIAILILGHLGFGLAPEMPDHITNLGHPAITLVGIVLAGYAHVTGWFVTIASLALGWLVGFAANTKMPHEWQKSLDDAFVSRPTSAPK
jgi:hypothetical protein